MRLPRIITHVEEVSATDFRPPSRRYHVPSCQAVIERWLTRGFPPTIRSYMVYRTLGGGLLSELGGADTLAQALRRLGWTPQRPARSARTGVEVEEPGGWLVPRMRPPRVRKPRPSSPETREAERQRRQQRRQERKVERAARVEALMQENDEMLLAHPGRRPLQRQEAEWYENQRHRRIPSLSAYALTLAIQRLEKEAARQEEREQAREEQAREQERAEREARRRARTAERERGLALLQEVCPAAQESDWALLQELARGDERLTACLEWFHHVVPRRFTTVVELRDRVRQECRGLFRGGPTQFQSWEQTQAPRPAVSP